MLSVPRGTEMFQFPHLPPHALCVQAPVAGHDPRRVAPFGYRRRVACLRPTVAFRSLPRPSSARVAEASTAYRFLLERDGISPSPVSGSSERAITRHCTSPLAYPASPGQAETQRTL